MSFKYPSVLRPQNGICVNMMIFCVVVFTLV